MILAILLISVLLIFLDLTILLSFSHSLTLTFIIITQLISAGVGFYFIHKIKLKTYFFVEAELKKGTFVVLELWHECLILIGGVLILIPGFITDGMGYSLLNSSVRDYLIENIIPDHWTM